MTASYGGDAVFASSASGVVTEAVIASATDTSLTATPTATTYGGSVTFSATVTSGGGTPTGTVTFRDDATVIGTVGLVDGQASLTTSALAVGSHTVTASYDGSVAFATSTSTAVSESVAAAATTTTLTASPNPSSFGSAVTLTATVTSPDGVPPGSVTFLDGAAALGSGTLNAGQVTLVTSSLTVGSHSITAVYGATANFTASTSAAVAETVTASAGNVLSVDRGNANCRDTGTGAGSAATPFCTIGAAASIATAGVTVVVASGTYAGNVTVKNSGTSIAPVTITTGPGANVIVTGGTNGFIASSKSWIVIRGFNVTQTSGSGITVSNGH